MDKLKTRKTLKKEISGIVGPFIGFRVTPTQHKLLRVLATNYGTTTSQVLRAMIDQVELPLKLDAMAKK